MGDDRRRRVGACPTLATRRSFGFASGSVELVVQVDGRVRDRVTVPAALSPTETRARAEAAPNVVRHLGGRPVAGCVHVSEGLVNLVTEPS